jgi:hypothetical protein
MVPLGRDLIGLKPDVLVAGSMSGALAAQAATQTSRLSLSRLTTRLHSGLRAASLSPAAILRGCGSTMTRSSTSGWNAAGGNLRIDYRWSPGDLARLRKDAAELVDDRYGASNLLQDKRGVRARVHQLCEVQRPEVILAGVGPQPTIPKAQFCAGK